MNNTVPCIAITAGEPAGIGLDLCAMLATRPLDASIVVIADQYALAERARMHGLAVDIQPYQADAKQHLGTGKLNVMHLPSAEKVIAGQLDAANSNYVLQSLRKAIDGCRQGDFDAMVTAPVHKGIINDAGIAFTGHTEYLAEYTDTPQVVMMLVGGGIRVALATRHLPLSEVSSAITPTSLETTIRILHTDLVRHFGIKQPRILVAGLNPHAGEGGYLGM